jgi:predicted RNA binding protein YcfA (HicA-like mRNA interferase family)
MAKLPRLTGKELAKIIEKFGFVHSHTTGSHMVFKHSDGRRTTIPIHAGEEIGPGLLNKITKKDLLIAREESLKHL